MFYVTLRISMSYPYMILLLSFNRIILNW